MTIQSVSTAQLPSQAATQLGSAAQTTQTGASPPPPGDGDGSVGLFDGVLGKALIGGVAGFAIGALPFTPFGGVIGGLIGATLGAGVGIFMNFRKIKDIQSKNSELITAVGVQAVNQADASSMLSGGTGVLQGGDPGQAASQTPAQDASQTTASTSTTTQPPPQVPTSATQQSVVPNQAGTAQQGSAAQTTVDPGPLQTAATSGSSSQLTTATDAQIEASNSRVSQALDLFSQQPVVIQGGGAGGSVVQQGGGLVQQRGGTVQQGGGDSESEIRARLDECHRVARQQIRELRDAARSRLHDLRLRIASSTSADERRELVEQLRSERRRFRLQLMAVRQEHVQQRADLVQQFGLKNVEQKAAA